MPESRGLWVPDGSGGHKKISAGVPDDVRNALRLGRVGIADDQSEVDEVGKTRAKRYRTASGSSSDIEFATSRSKDPFFYWRQNNLPFELDKPEELKRLRDICRAVYLTNPVIASAIDIYSRFPLVGCEFRCKDPELVEFYTDLFFDQLDYEEYLVDVLREYWLVGEAWPFGSFNEQLGIWEDDELLNPDDIRVIRTPFAREPRFEMKLPETLRKIINERSPKWEFDRLMASYPELKNYVGENERMPVSNVLLRQIAFKADTFHPRGIPIMMRGIRYIIQEEMLNAAQEAVAQRLYMPLVLATLGASASDLGTESPWIPTSGDLDDFELRLDAAFAADFRILVHHFAVDMKSVFGREVMPRLDQDFERLTEKQLQVFGLSKTLISGAQGGETYAADALNRDLITQMLTKGQKRMKRFVRDRALVVAEAQQHFDYEERGGKRYPIMEEVVEVDPDTGEKRIVQQPKLLVPELHLKTMNMRSEEDEQSFIEALRASGIPISQKTRLTNVPIDLEEEIELTEAEQVEQAVSAMRVKRETYKALRDEGLPIPPDLQIFEPKAQENDNATASTVVAAEEPEPEVPIPTLGTELPVDPMALTPPTDPAELAKAQEGGGAGVPPEDGPPANNVIQLPTNAWSHRLRPMESDEKQGEAHSAALHVEDLGRPVDGFYTPYSAAAIYSTEAPPVDEGEEPAPGDFESETFVDARAGALQYGPRHVGIRRFAGLDPNLPMEDQIRAMREASEQAG